MASVSLQDIGSWFASCGYSLIYNALDLKKVAEVSRQEKQQQQDGKRGEAEQKSGRFLDP
jgi:hypothetical protein